MDYRTPYSELCPPQGGPISTSHSKPTCAMRNGLIQLSHTAYVTCACADVVAQVIPARPEPEPASGPRQSWSDTEMYNMPGSWPGKVQTQDVSSWLKDVRGESSRQEQTSQEETIVSRAMITLVPGHEWITELENE